VVEFVKNLLTQISYLGAVLDVCRTMSIVVVKVETPEGRAVPSGHSFVILALYTASTEELGVMPCLNPFGDLYGLLAGVIISPTPIATAFISDSEVRAGDGLGGFLGFSHRQDIIHKFIKNARRFYDFFQSYNIPNNADKDKPRLAGHCFTKSNNNKLHYPY
jgi:hypothetical protein